MAESRLRGRTWGSTFRGEGAGPSGQRRGLVLSPARLCSFMLSGSAQIAAFRLDKTPLELISLEPPRGRGGRGTEQPRREPDTPFPEELHPRGQAVLGSPFCSLGYFPFIA